MTKIEYRTLNELAYEEIKKGLISGRFSPGQVLVIRTLAEIYGISTTPVREALQRLVAERLLTMQPNRSIAVPGLAPETFAELARIRCALEGLAGALAAETVTDARVAHLSGLIEEIEQSITRRDTAAYLGLNQRFHFTVYGQAESPRLLQMIQDLWGQVGPFFNDLFADDGYIGHANEQHILILEGLKARDPEAVRRHVVRDIEVAAASIMPRLGLSAG